MCIPQRRTCSDIFCTVHQVGGFGGLDTSFIDTEHTNSRSDDLSDKRDALSLQGRPDIKAQYYDRSVDKTSRSYIPREMIEHTLRFAEKLYPDSTARTLPQ